MERIVYGNVLAPTSIVEYVDFSTDRPYTVSIKSFATEEITVPHYGDFFELLVCYGARGSMIIAPEQYALEGDMAFIIPPKMVHTVHFEQGPGHAFVIKLPLSSPGGLLNLEKLLCSCGKSTNVSSIRVPDVPKLLDALNRLIAQDNNPVLRLSAMLELIACLMPCFQSLQEAESQQTPASDPLRRVIDWTEENLSEAILVDGAAQVAGYSKHYFCRWFKASTSFTYGEYVQRIRVTRACRYLLEGKSVTETSHLCGYENTSYFIRIFSRYRHCTPKEYCRNYYALEKNSTKVDDCSQ